MTSRDSIGIAFKDLFDKEYGKLCRYALTYVRDMHLAEDVVQDTFIKIWEQKRELISSEDIRFYLITAVRNNSISMLRKQNREQLHYTDEIQEPEPEAFITVSQMKEEATDRAARVSEALNKLPPKCREVFLLIKLHGMSYKQAAENLGISTKTIENQMGKAIKIFRDISVSHSVAFFFSLMLKEGHSTFLNLLK